MIHMIRYLLDWPRNENGEVIFRNTHQALFYSVLVYEMKHMVEEIEGLSEGVKRHLQREREKPAPNQTLMIQLACKHQFYRECIDTAKRLLQEEVK